MTAPAATVEAKASPTRDQIHAAIQRAVHSRDLWATVNVCNTKRHPGVIGIRAQMPSLGFGSDLDMRISVDFWSLTDKQFVPVPGAIKTIALRSRRTGVHQGGALFAFGPHTGYLRGSVTFRWTRGRQLLGQASRTTAAGHHDADFGDPAGYSSWRCAIN